MTHTVRTETAQAVAHASSADLALSLAEVLTVVSPEHVYYVTTR